ncbi:MAG: hypothetical protein WD232_04125 [Acidimicrobiales bacterium]
MLADGTYDAVVIDAEDVEGGDQGAVRVELTITSGEHKGEVVAVRGHVGRGSALDLLGMPATLVVAEMVPHLELD